MTRAPLFPFISLALATAAAGAAAAGADTAVAAAAAEATGAAGATQDTLCMVPGFTHLAALHGRCLGRLVVQGERHSGTNYLQALAERSWGDWYQDVQTGGAHAGCEEAWQPGYDASTRLDANVCCGKHGYLNASCVLRPPVEATIVVLR